MNKDRIILDLCGGTGSWSKFYAEAQYDVRVITTPDKDVRAFVAQYDQDRFPVYGILAAPPCNHFSVSGAQYWKAKDADGRTEEALDIVDACLNIIRIAQDEGGLIFWALENPVGRLRKIRKDRLGEPKLIFNPCDYGDPYTKKTLLWGNFTLPVQTPVEPIRSCKQGSWLQKLGGKSERTKRLRSMTPEGFARAFFEANR